MKDTTGNLDPAQIPGQDQAEGTIPEFSDSTGPLDPAQIPGDDQVSFEEKKPGEVKNIVSGLIKIPENVEVPKKGSQEREDFEDNYAESVAEKVGVSKEDVMVQIIDDMIGGGYYHLGGASVGSLLEVIPKISDVKDNLKDNNLLIDDKM